MNIHTNVPIKNFKSLPREEPIPIDSSALKEFQKCPRAYFLRYVLCYVPKDEKVWFAWGKAIHKFYEVAENKLKETNGNVDLSGALAMQAGLQEWGDTKDCPPEVKKFAHMNKANLSRVLIAVFKEWKKEKESGHIKVTNSEMSFVVQTKDGIWISGKMDQSIAWTGRKMIRDFKTTTKKWQWYKRELWPADQFIRYIYAMRKLSGERISSITIDVIIYNNEGLKFESEQFNYTSEEIDRWESAQKHWDDSLRRCRENDEYPMVERSCNFCDYREVCTTRGEQSQLYLLKSKFTRHVWDNAK